MIIAPNAHPVGLVGSIASCAASGGSGRLTASPRPLEIPVSRSDPTHRRHLEQLCRYLLRLRLLDDGRVVLTLKTGWGDGTRQLVFEPLELLEKLAALVPPPAQQSGALPRRAGAHAGWRARVVAYGAPPAAVAVASACPEATDESTPVVRHWA
jgi:Putative transposase